MAKMPIRQEKVLSSEFHMAMLQELEIHHGEKSGEWDSTDPLQMVDAAAQHLVMFTETGIRRHLVHSANYMAIAWAILGLGADQDLLSSGTVPKVRDVGFLDGS